MKYYRSTLLLAAGVLMLAACKGKEESAAEAAPANPLLSYVAADTPYLFANLEATPATVVDAYLERFQPSLALLQALLDDVSIEVSDEAGEDARQAALLGALIREVDGKLSREGLESLGLSLESHKAFHGMGVFPVMRVALKDADLLRAAIGRVETEAGMNFPVFESGSISYWKLAGGDMPFGLYIAVLPDHLAVSLFPTGMEMEFLPEFLGQAAPRQAFDANAVLAELNRSKDFTDFGSGFIDMHKLAGELMQPESRTGQALAAGGHIELPQLDADCTGEIRQLIDRAPRFVAGTTELTANRIGMRYQLEMEPTLASELVRLVSDVPVAAEDPDSILSMSLAVQVGRLREFLLEKATARVSSPFACQQLQPLNEAATSLLAQVNRPMPPFVGNLNGFRLKLDSLDFANPSPQSANGMLVLEVEKPQMLVGSAQMFIPGLEGLDLAPGSEPVEVPQELLTVAVDGMHVFAAMSKDALGIAMGQEQQPLLMGFLEADGDNGGTFLSVSYDMAAQMGFQQQMRDSMLGEHASDSPDEQHEHVTALLEEMQAAYARTLGRTRLELRFTPDGFEIENQMTFK